MTPQKQKHAGGRPLKIDSPFHPAVLAYWREAKKEKQKDNEFF